MICERRISAEDPARQGSCYSFWGRTCCWSSQGRRAGKRCKTMTPKALCHLAPSTDLLSTEMYLKNACTTLLRQGVFLFFFPFFTHAGSIKPWCVPSVNGEQFVTASIPQTTGSSYRHLVGTLQLALLLCSACSGTRHAPNEPLPGKGLGRLYAWHLHQQFWFKYSVICYCPRARCAAVSAGPDSIPLQHRRSPARLPASQSSDSDHQGEGW